MKTRIIGLIVDSGGVPVNGILRINATSAFPDSDATLNTLLLPETYEFELVDGEIDIQLHESETARVSYTFKAYTFNKENTDFLEPLYNEDPVWELTTFIPKSVQPVSINELAQTGLRVSNGDSAVQLVVTALERSESFKDLVGRIFRDKGTFNDEEIYRFNDIVYYPDMGRQYRYVSDSPSVGNIPVKVVPAGEDNLNTEYWAYYGGDKGDIGTGTAGNNTPYDFSTNGTSWDNSLEAPTKNAVRDAIEQLELKQHAQNTFAPINSPNFTGYPTAPTPITSDNSGAIATTAFVRNVATSASVGFTPVQQGGTVNFTDNKLYIGWSSENKLKAQVDNNLLGNFAFEGWTNQNFYTKLQTDDIFAPKNNPTFTGNVIVPTVASTDNSTKVATTAYVKNQNYQPNLGFNPIQEGGGVGHEGGHKIRIGWSGAIGPDTNKLKAQVDSSVIGNIALESWVRGLVSGSGSVIRIGNIKIQFGSTVITTSASFADGTVTMPEYMTLVTVIVCDGDNNNTSNVDASLSVFGTSYGQNTNQFVISAAFQRQNALLRVNWVAFGY